VAGFVTVEFVVKRPFECTQLAQRGSQSGSSLAKSQRAPSNQTREPSKSGSARLAGPNNASRNHHVLPLVLVYNRHHVARMLLREALPAEQSKMQPHCPGHKAAKSDHCRGDTGSTAADAMRTELGPYSTYNLWWPARIKLTPVRPAAIIHPSIRDKEKRWTNTNKSQGTQSSEHDRDARARREGLLVHAKRFQRRKRRNGAGNGAL